MAELNSTPALQTSHLPQVKSATKTVIPIELDSDLLEIIERFGGTPTMPTVRGLRSAQRAGIQRALAWAALAFLNSENQTEMLVDMVPVHMHLAAIIRERREIAELTRLYNLPDTTDEAPAS
jgi:hypothetical protein